MSGIYADEFTVMFLQALDAFYGKKLLEAERKLAALRVHAGASEKNNEDKIHLLAGRLMLKTGESL